MGGLPPALAKQYGPFNGITWIGIIGGGVVLAIVLRKAFSGATPEAQEAAPASASGLKLPGTTYHQDTSAGHGTAPVPTAPIPVKTPPISFDQAPGDQCPKGYHINLLTGKCVPNVVVQPPPKDPGPVAPPPPPKPGPIVPPPPPKIPTPAQDIPGGFPADCKGVFSLPPDYPGANVTAWIHASNNPAQRSGKALGWAIGGQETPLTPGKLQLMKAAISAESAWPLINSQRRARGLRPLSRQVFQSAKNDIVAQAASGRDAFPDSFIQHLWDTYYMPYICVSVPSQVQNLRLV